MIQRFEDEYPECKLAALPLDRTRSDSVPVDQGSRPSFKADASASACAETGSTETNGTAGPTGSGEETTDNLDDDDHTLKLSRTASSTSIASKALTHEEGRMHRFGQSVRREIARAGSKATTNPPLSSSAPSSNQPNSTHAGGDDDDRGTDDAATKAQSQASRLRALQERLGNMAGEEIAQFRQKCNSEGIEKALSDLGVTAQELIDMEMSDPEGFERFRESQVAARYNAGIE